MGGVRLCRRLPRGLSDARQGLGGLDGRVEGLVGLDEGDEDLQLRGLGGACRGGPQGLDGLQGRVVLLFGPNLAKGQILANAALCRVFQWQTFVHV